MSGEAYEAADALLEALAVLATRVSPETFERLERLIDRLPALLEVLEIVSSLDPETLRKLVVALNSLTPLVSCIAESTDQALSPKAEPVKGVRGLLSILRDEEAMRGLARLVVVLRKIGECRTG